MSRTTIRSWLPVVFGLAVLTSLAIMEIVRGVDRVETAALVLFGLVACASAVSMGWGVAAALVATVAYALLRRNALDIAGSDSLNRMILARAIGFLGFGTLFGAATRVLRPILASSQTMPAVTSQTTHGERAVSTLGLDSVDVLNREVARARRHHHPLTAITIDLTGDDQDSELIGSLRASDYVLRGNGGNGSELTIILPETDADAAEELAGRIGRAREQHVISLVSADDTEENMHTDELEHVRGRLRGAK